MGNRLKDKVAIITGAAKGIEFATAQRFAQEGAKVIITDINQETVIGAVAQTPNAEGFTMNVTDRASTQVAIDQVMQKHGRESWDLKAFASMQYVLGLLRQKW